MKGLQTILRKDGFDKIVSRVLKNYSNQQTSEKHFAENPGFSLANKTINLLTRNRIQVEYDIEQFKQIPEGSNLIAIANHVSNHDGLYILNSLFNILKETNRKKLFPHALVGDNLLTNPMFNKLVKFFGGISVSRKTGLSDFEVLKAYKKQFQSILDNSKSLFYFPEATRTRTGKLNNFEATGGTSNMILKHYLNNPQKELYFVTAGIAYEQIPEIEKIIKNKNSRALQSKNFLYELFKYFPKSKLNFEVFNINEFFKAYDLNPEETKYSNELKETFCNYLQNKVQSITPIFEEKYVSKTLFEIAKENEPINITELLDEIQKEINLPKKVINKRVKYLRKIGAVSYNRKGKITVTDSSKIEYYANSIPN